MSAMFVTAGSYVLAFGRNADDPAWQHSQSESDALRDLTTRQACRLEFNSLSSIRSVRDG